MDASLLLTMFWSLIFCGCGCCCCCCSCGCAGAAALLTWLRCC